MKLYYKIKVMVPNIIDIKVNIVMDAPRTFHLQPTNTIIIISRQECCSCSIGKTERSLNCLGKLHLDSIFGETGIKINNIKKIMIISNLCYLKIEINR